MDIAIAIRLNASASTFIMAAVPRNDQFGRSVMHHANAHLRRSSSIDAVIIRVP